MAPPSGSHSPGDRLRASRERLGLSLRDVRAASARIAKHLDNEEFAISLGHLSNIESKGALPNIYRLYSLCEIYHLDLPEVLSWYGIHVGRRGRAASAGQVR